MKDRIEKWKQLILDFFPIRYLIILSKKVVLPGFEGMPIYDVALFFWNGLKNGRITTRSNSMAFQFFLSLFPFIIFLFALIPYIPIDNFRDSLMAQMEFLLPENAFAFLKETIDDIATNQRGALLTFNIVFSGYFASNAISSMIQEFDSSVNVVATRSWLKQRAVALLLAAILTILILMATAIIVFTEIFAERVFGADSSLYDLVVIGRWPILLALFYFAISFLYFFGPSGITNWRFFSAGSSLATVLILLTAGGFSYFVDNFGRYNKLYGSIGTLIVIMMWFNLAATALLVGFELNAGIRRAKVESDNRSSSNG